MIGLVKLGTDAILAMVSTATTDRDGVDGSCGQAAGVSTTWLELETGGGVDKNTLATKARNPFESLGDIAVAVKAQRALPSSLEEYRRTRQEGRGTADSSSRGVADATVLVRTAKRSTRKILQELVKYGRCLFPKYLLTGSRSIVNSIWLMVPCVRN